jgi:hypothetical protein
VLDLIALSARIILSLGESKLRLIYSSIRGSRWNSRRLGTGGQLDDVGNSIIDYVNLIISRIVLRELLKIYV